MARADHGARRLARHALLQHAVRRHRGRFPRDPRRAGLQDRVVRVHRPAADPQGGPHRQADDHLDRHGQPGRDRRGGAHRARARLRTDCAAQVHQHLPGHAAEHQHQHDPRDACIVRLRGRPVGPHDGLRRLRRFRRVRRSADRKALHAAPRRWWRRLVVLARAAGVPAAAHRDRTGLAIDRQRHLRRHQGGRQVACLPPHPLRRPRHEGRRGFRQHQPAHRAPRSRPAAQVLRHPAG